MQYAPFTTVLGALQFLGHVNFNFRFGRNYYV